MSYNLQNFLSSYALLSHVTGVDLATTGQTTLYTVPTGKTLIITEVILRVTAANAVIIVPSLRIGKASSYNEWLPITALTSLNATDKFLMLSSSAALLMHQSFAAGEVVKIDVTTGATATTLTAEVFTFGFLI